MIQTQEMWYDNSRYVAHAYTQNVNLIDTDKIPP